MVDKTEYLKEGDRFRFQQITVEARKFEPQDERWNLFSLSDGNLLKVKLIVSSIRKADLYNTFGEPIYYVSHNVSYATIKEE